jgi:TatD DNase family protein
MAEFYDTHAHLVYPDFAPEIDAVVARAAAAGITRIISIGTDLENSARAVAMAEQYPGVYAAVGWHPGDAMDAPPDVREELRRLARHPKVVAIGETGLDYYRLPSKETGRPEDDVPVIRKQMELLRQHMEVAAELGLNCVIHQRHCFHEALEAVRPFADRVRAVFHCFVGSSEEMQAVLAVGGYVSFTGILTFKNADEIRGTLARVPAGRFMLETDSPFLAPVPYRGKRCEPAHVSLVAARAAEVRGCSLEVLAEQTCQAAHAFFPKLG